MKKNNPSSMNAAHKKGIFLAFRIIVYVAVAVVVGLAVLYFIESTNQTMSFFSLHFAVPIILAMIGIIAILLPKLTKKSYSGDTKGDNFMTLVGVLLILCAVMSLGLSFIQQQKKNVKKWKIFPQVFLFTFSKKYDIVKLLGRWPRSSNEQKQNLRGNR